MEICATCRTIKPDGSMTFCWAWSPGNDDDEHDFDFFICVDCL